MDRVESCQDYRHCCGYKTSFHEDSIIITLLQLHVITTYRSHYRTTKSEVSTVWQSLYTPLLTQETLEVGSIHSKYIEHLLVMEKRLVIAQNPCRSSFNNRGVHFHARVHIYKRLSTDIILNQLIIWKTSITWSHKLVGRMSAKTWITISSLFIKLKEQGPQMRIDLIY